MALEDAISTQRLATYRNWAQQNEGEALELYALNVAISEAFYTSLHMLEITLRNSVHNQMTNMHGQTWFNDQTIITDQFQQRKVADAYAKFRGNASDGQIVAELTLGFWTALFGRRYSQLWGQSLRPIFTVPVQRRQIARRLSEARRLRNRIMHYEPIIQHNLFTIHQDIMELIGWMSVDALSWCNARCRFNNTHPGIQIIVGNLRNPQLVLQ